MVGKDTYTNHHTRSSKTRELTAGSEYGTNNLKSLLQSLFLYLILFADDMASASKRFVFCIVFNPICCECDNFTSILNLFSLSAADVLVSGSWSFISCGFLIPSCLVCSNVNSFLDHCLVCLCFLDCGSLCCFLVFKTFEERSHFIC